MSKYKTITPSDLIPTPSDRETRVWLVFLLFMVILNYKRRAMLY